MDEIVEEILEDVVEDVMEELPEVVFETNYYFNSDLPHKPFTVSGTANPNTFPPENAVRFPPEFVEGQWPTMQDGQWVNVPDRRGEKIWSISTKEEKENPEVIIMEGWTDQEPPADYYYWDGEWLATDEALLAAEEAEKQRKYEVDMATANVEFTRSSNVITTLNRKVQRGLATDADRELLIVYEDYNFALLDFLEGITDVLPTVPKG